LYGPRTLYSAFYTRRTRLILEVSEALCRKPRCYGMNENNHGHSAGDLALQKLGSLIRHSFGQSDTAARYGGEEFVVLLPETELESARKKVESLRELVATTPFALAPRGEPVQVTISAGLACFPQEGDDELGLFGSGYFKPSTKAATAWWPPPRPSYLSDL
jgi:hypothetical protein